MPTSTATPRPKKTRLQRTLRRVANPLNLWSLRVGLPSPPYTRRNSMIIETIGRRSGKRYRIPVGFLAENGKLIVVAEDGLRAAWVRNALARDGSCACSSVGVGAMRAFSRGRGIPSRICAG